MVYPWLHPPPAGGGGVEGAREATERTNGAPVDGIPNVIEHRTTDLWTIEIFLTNCG